MLRTAWQRGCGVARAYVTVTWATPFIAWPRRGRCQSLAVGRDCGPSAETVFSGGAICGFCPVSPSRFPGVFVIVGQKWLYLTLLTHDHSSLTIRKAFSPSPPRSSRARRPRPSRSLCRNPASSRLRPTTGTVPSRCPRGVAASCCYQCECQGRWNPRGGHVSPGLGRRLPDRRFPGASQQQHAADGNLCP